MAIRSLTIRFYIARMSASSGTYNWPPGAKLRDVLHPVLPGIGANGVSVNHLSESFLVETIAYDPASALHLQISKDLEEVPAVRTRQRTGPLALAAGQVPASVSHLTFLPSGVVAVVRGTASPGPHQSAAILRSATGVPFHLEALTRTDQLQALNNSTAATTVEFTATVIDPTIAAGDAVFTAARQLLGVQDFEVTVKLVAKSKGGKQNLRRVARRLIEGQRDAAIDLRRGKAQLSGPSRLVDLLDDQIVEQRTVQLQVPAGQALVTLTAAEVLNEVRDAYNSLLVVVGSALAETPSDFPETPP